MGYINSTNPIDFTTFNPYCMEGGGRLEPSDAKKSENAYVLTKITLSRDNTLSFNFKRKKGVKQKLGYKCSPPPHNTIKEYFTQRLNFEK